MIGVWPWSPEHEMLSPLGRHTAKNSKHGQVKQKPAMVHLWSCDIADWNVHVSLLSVLQEKSSWTLVFRNSSVSFFHWEFLWFSHFKLILVHDKLFNVTFGIHLFYILSYSVDYLVLQSYKIIIIVFKTMTGKILGKTTFWI